MRRTGRPSRRAWLGVAAAVATATVVVLMVWSGEADVTREEAARVGAAALQVVGGGEVASVERSGSGDAAWRVDVIQGTQVVEVSVDDELRPLAVTAEPAHGDPANAELAAIGEQFEYRRGAKEELREDQQLPRGKREKAAEAARRAIGGGKVTYVEESEDPGEAYEVDISRGATELEVLLSRRYEVVRVNRFR